jgi:hypothetical protein
MPTGKRCHMTVFPYFQKCRKSTASTRLAKIDVVTGMFTQTLPRSITLSPGKAAGPTGQRRE